MKTKSMLFFIAFINLSSLYAQNETQKIEQPIINTNIFGKVIDEISNEFIAGAKITIENVTNLTYTDTNGSFNLITGQKLPFNVIVSVAGYETKKIYVTEKNVIFKLNAQQNKLSEVIINSRKRKENAQNLPISVAVLSGITAEKMGAFNVNRIKELTPSVQLYSSNARNTSLNIRGLGSTFGLTNDGIDPGVGFYIDGVYYTRAAATSLDFVDLEQIEIFRGPQGTLFGKNTTAGAFNLTTKPASFKSESNFEVSYGNYNFIQSKASITGALSSKLAIRISFSGTQRNGTIYNIKTFKNVNTLNNLGGKTQLLFTPINNIKITLNGDINQQHPDGYTQVVAGTVKTQFTNYKQFETIIKDLNYSLPSKNPFDRLTDINSPIKANNNLGGVSLNTDIKFKKGSLNSTTAYRYWIWDSMNDRDYLGLDALKKSQAPSKHQQWSQEIRYTNLLNSKIKSTFGIFAIWQNLQSNPKSNEEAGKDQWRFVENNNNLLWQTPGLLDGYGLESKTNLKSFSGAAFGQMDWEMVKNIHLLTGLRFNYDKKEAKFESHTYGGLITNNSELLMLQKLIYKEQNFVANVKEKNLTGLLTLQYKINPKVNTFATFSNAYKPSGINMAGLPIDKGRVMTELATIKPEYVTHYEIGIKTSPLKNAELNLILFNTNVKDYQTQVQSIEPGLNRGYLSNAEKVRVTGIEIDGFIHPLNRLFIKAALSYTDGKYIKFINAPNPLEELGSPTNFKNISGGTLPGISEWSGTLSTEYTLNGKLLNWTGKYFLGIDNFFRSAFSSSPTPSKYLNIPGYNLLNARLGFNASNALNITLWSRNLLNKNYFEQLNAVSSYGYYTAILGDPITYGITLKYSL